MRRSRVKVPVFKLHDLESMAELIHVSPDWLRERSLDGTVPCLNGRRGLLYVPTPVLEAVLKLAASPLSEEDRAGLIKTFDEAKKQCGALKMADTLINESQSHE